MRTKTDKNTATKTSTIKYKLVVFGVVCIIVIV